MVMTSDQRSCITLCICLHSAVLHLFQNEFHKASSRALPLAADIDTDASRESEQRHGQTNTASCYEHLNMVQTKTLQEKMLTSYLGCFHTHHGAARAQLGLQSRWEIVELWNGGTSSLSHWSEQVKLWSDVTFKDVEIKHIKATKMG